MQEFLVSILLGFSALLGIQKLPTVQQDWKITDNWTEEDGSWTLSATNNEINKICSAGKFLILPQVIHGIHKVYSDKKLIYQSGDDTFKKTSSFYERGVVQCNYLSNAKEVKWTVKTYSKYFARIHGMPITANSSKYFFLDVIVNIVASGCLIILALFSLFIF